MVVLITAVLLALPTMATADEIWVHPGQEGPNGKVGNWGTAKLGGLFLLNKETHFAFHVPDNYDHNATQPDERAIIVVIPPSTTTLDYTVKLNVAREGESHTTNPLSFSSSQAVTKNSLTEIDVTALVPALIASDYVTVNLELNGFTEKTQVVGMRFQFVSTVVTVSTDTIADDAVTGDKVADEAVDSRKLADKAVESEKIADEAVDSRKLAEKAVVREKIAVEAVDSTRLAREAVVREKIAVEAVDSTRLAEEAVVREKIAVEAVDSTRLADDAVVREKIAVDAVDSSKIAAEAVGPSEIATNAVGSSEIAADAVGSSEIAAEAVGSSEIADDAVGSSELKNNLIERPCEREVEDGATVMSVTCACNPTEVGWSGMCSFEPKLEAPDPTLQSGGLFYDTSFTPPAWVWQCVWGKPVSATYDITAQVVCLK